MSSFPAPPLSVSHPVIIIRRILSGMELRHRSGFYETMYRHLFLLAPSKFSMKDFYVT